MRTSLLASPSLAPSTRSTPLETPSFERAEFGLCLGVEGPARRPTDSYVLYVPMDGATRHRGFASISNPRETPVAQATGTTPMALHIRISRDLVEDELAAMLGHPADGPVRFDTTVHLRETPASGIGVLAEELAAQMLAGHELLTHPLLQLRQVRTLTAACLLAQPHNFSSALLLGQPPLRPRTLRRAMQFIAENLTETLTLDDLARSAGCSGRTLNSAFREHLDATPMTYLRNLRLERVRDELLAGDDPIGTVAYRWGFTHLGRFAGAYAHRFGELPSETVARGR
jgi:AraC-like DNA-binding protein